MEAKQAVKRASKKFDPKQEAFARELKDRWLEAVVAQPDLLAAERSKYDVRRQVALPGKCPWQCPRSSSTDQAVGGVRD